jgi:hypothetical protein
MNGKPDFTKKSVIDCAVEGEVVLYDESIFNPFKFTDISIQVSCIVLKILSVSQKLLPMFHLLFRNPKIASIQ